MMEREGRMVGNTTRIVDKCIQDLFDTGTCFCRDNIDVEEAHKIVFDKVSKRLRLEHKLIWNTIDMNYKNRSFSLPKK